MAREQTRERGGALRRALPDLGYVGLSLVFFFDIFLLGARFLGRDLPQLFYPNARLLGAALRGEGSLLWDATLSHGMPLLARWVPGVLYPPNWLAALLSPADTFAVLLPAHLVLAAMGLRRLALCFTQQRAAAWVAGLGYAFGGYALSMLGSGHYLFAMALLPWALWAYVRLVREPSLARALQLVPLLVLQVFVGDPQTLYYQALLFFPALLLLGIDRQNYRQRLVWAAVAGGLALALSASQLLPTFEFSRHSVRAAGLPYAEAATWAFHPLRLLEWLAPGVFGGITPENSYWARSLINGPHNNPWALGTHLGLLLLLGVVVSLARRPRGAVALWGGVALLCWLLALGPHTPLHRLVHVALPGAAAFRYPEKFMLFVALALSVLGAVGLGTLLTASDDPHERRCWRVALIALAACTMVLGGAWFYLGPAGGLELSRFAAFLAAQGAKVRPVVAGEHLVSSLGRAALFAAALLIVFAARRHLRPALLVALAGLLMTGELWLAGRTMVLRGGQGWLRRPPGACKLLPGDEKPLVWRLPLRFRDTPLLGSPTRIERQRRFQYESGKENTLAGYCARYASGYTGTRLARHALIVESLAKSARKTFGLLGVQVVIAPSGAIRSHAFASRGRSELGFEVYRLLEVAPKAFGLAKVAVAPDLDGARRWLEGAAYRPGASAVFEASAPLPAGGPSAPRVSALVRRPGVVQLQVEAPESGYLVIKESHYPGWVARIDGRPTRIYAANGLFLGLAVPAGTHRIVLSFESTTQQLGNAVSAAGLALYLLGWFFVSWRRRRALAIASLKRRA